MNTATPKIAVVGGGPGGLVAAIAFASRGAHVTVFDRDVHPDEQAAFDPERSYPIDLTGHGLNAVRAIDATRFFDARMTPFRGLQHRGKTIGAWDEPGWIGSRGDITRSLAAVIAERHADTVEFVLGAAVTDVDVHAGTVQGRDFDLVIGADGAGSVVRAAMERQVDGFTVTVDSLANWGKVLELDLVGDAHDREHLQAVTLNPFTMAGVIHDADAPDGVRWLSVLGTKEPLDFTDVAQARAWMKKKMPKAMPLASDDAVAAMVRRASVPLGRRLMCSTLHGGKAVLIGDAAATYPPIGQGCNAAMEAATVLAEAYDAALAAGATAANVAAETGPRYDAVWWPETRALGWLGWQIRFEHPLTVVRGVLGQVLGHDLSGESKKSTRSYASVVDAAQKISWLWAK